MSDDSSSSSLSTPPNTKAGDTSASFQPTWQLPQGIEDDLTRGLVHAAVGVTLGGLAGLLLFQRGKGNRAMSMAAGLGVAMGATYERAVVAKQEDTTTRQDE